MSGGVRGMPPVGVAQAPAAAAPMGDGRAGSLLAAFGPLRGTAAGGASEAPRGELDKASSHPAADDEMGLTPAGRAAFADALFEAVPPGLAVFHANTFRDLNSGRKVAAYPPLEEFYTSPVIVAAIEWIGARTELARKGPPDAACGLAGVQESGLQYSTKYDLAGLVHVMEARFDRMVKAELSRFWDEVGELPASAGPAPLRTMRNLAMQWAIIIGVTFVYLQMLRLEAARSLIHQLVLVWGQMGVPSSRPRNGEPLPVAYGLDDLFLNEHWLDAFYSVCYMDLRMTSLEGGGTAPTFHPALDFPDVHLVLPIELVRSSVPIPSWRTPNGPVPTELLAAIPRFDVTCRDFLGWLDPSLSPPVGDTMRSRILSTCVTDMENSGTAYLGILLAAVTRRVTELRRFLRETARLTMLDVMIAEELLARSGIDPDCIDSSSASLVVPAGLDSAYVRRVLANPHLSSIIRQRTFLSSAVSSIQAALPAGLSAAFRASDFDAFELAVPFLRGPLAQHHLLAELLDLWRVALMLVCPEPAEDPDAWAGRPTSDADGDPVEGEADMVRKVWFVSPSFAGAFGICTVIAGNARMLLARFGAEGDGFQRNLFAPIACAAAGYAAWLLTLVLKRFSWIAADAFAADAARAVDLHSALVSDVGACLDLLDASGRGDAATVLRNLLAGDRAGLTRADLQMLRAARAMAARCPHLASGELGRAGHCWMCAAQRSGRRASAVGIENALPPDPLSAFPDYADRVTRTDSSFSSSTGHSWGSHHGPGVKRVRFADEDVEYETYAKEEYPARSMYAPDDEEEGDADEGEFIFREPDRGATMNTLLARLRSG
ncbi:hypothetical protein DFJ74DRAFT_730010 [Hyaloraphidium curvatum]|nr:hypothetical protein DFJ74DRAFT_730010 [Hyaloraphidium curvatum]